MMKRNSKLFAMVAASIAAILVTPALGQPTPTPYAAHLTGYEETPLTLNTTGSGDFKAVVSADGTSITYMLAYRDLSSPATQAHIHFGRPAIGGGIVLWLCGNNPPITPPTTIPTPQPCPPFPATIFGTLTAADVVAVSGQGIDAGAAGFAEMVAALRTGSAYANVHTTVRPSGEIRARLGPFPATTTTDTSND
jgi:CHRD domain